jgi:sulfonate transport system substrate-binding protein
MSWAPAASLGTILLLAHLTSAAPAHGQDLLTEETSLALPSESLTFATTYIAYDLGLFRREGLEVKLLDGAGSLGTDAVLSGKADFTATDAGTLARLTVRGEHLLAIAGLSNRPMMEVVLRTSLPSVLDYDALAGVEERARLLKGRTIAVESLGGDLHAYLALVARKARLDPEKDLRIMAMPTAGMPAALAAARIDGFAAGPPWTSAALGDGSAVIIASSPNGDLPEFLPFASSLLVTRPAVCEQRRTVCEKIVRGYLWASRVLRLNKDWAFDTLKRRFGPKISDATLMVAAETIRQGAPRLPVVNVIGIENSELFGLSAGLIKFEETLRGYDRIYSNAYVGR